jgi:threonine synthase
VVLMRAFDAVLRCAAGCDGDLPLWRPIYNCPRCGDLLRVAHDVEALRQWTRAEWLRLLDERAATARWPFRSPVWSRKEWVCPGLHDRHIVSLDEGTTALVHAERLGHQAGVEDLWIKPCGGSHTGSFKDRGMTVLVSAVRQMIAEGAGVRAIGCASTGDTSAALAAYAAAAGIPALVILPRGLVTPAQLVQPLANGARVLSLDTDFDGCMRIVRRLAEQDGVYLANSMNSLRLEGQKTVAFDIAREFDWEPPDFVIVPGGNLGHVTAIGAGFELLRDLGVTSRSPRLVVAQAEAANPLYRAYARGWRYEPIAARPTLASAIRIGDPVSVRKAIDVLCRHDGIVEQATEQELSDAAARADATGLYTCPHTAVALSALARLVARGEIPRASRVVVVSTASALKFTEFKTGYHAGTLPSVTSSLANRPIELPADYDAVRRAVDTATAGAPAG